MRGLTIPGTPIGPAPDHVPTDPQLASARRVLAQHRRQRYPEGRYCGWCRESYPCTPRRDAESLLRTAGLAPTPKAAELATVPGLSRRQRRDHGTVTQAQLMLLHTGH